MAKSLDEALKMLIDRNDGYVVDYKKGMENYTISLHNLAEAAYKKCKKNNVSFNEIARTANMSSSTVKHFLKKETQPNLVIAICVIRAIAKIIVQREKTEGYKLDAKALD